MRGFLDFLFRLLKLDHQNMVPEVLLFAAVIWLVMVACAFFSIRSQGMARAGKIGWALVVMLVPLFGVALYAMYCLTRQDYSFLKIFSGGQMERSKNSALARLQHARAAHARMTGRPPR